MILSVDGQAVNDQAGLDYRIATRHPGDQVVLRIRQGKAIHDLTVRVEPAPAIPARDERTITGRNPLGGATVVNVSPAVAQELGVDPFVARGVLVTRVGDGTVAENVGMRPGDVIRRINGREIRTTEDLPPALTAGGGSWRVTIQRGDQEITGDFNL